MLATELGLDETAEVETFEVERLLGARGPFHIAALDRRGLHPITCSTIPPLPLPRTSST